MYPGFLEKLFSRGGKALCYRALGQGPLLVTLVIHVSDEGFCILKAFLTHPYWRSGPICFPPISIC